HTASGFARMRNRLQTFACTSSVGPGATNMVTGAALATINRLPVLLLPGDVFASRRPDPVLQQLEVPWRWEVSVNDCFQPVSRYWDRITRPEQVVPAALAAMRVLTDQAETGAVTLALPQDVQAEAFDYPLEFLEPRVWRLARPRPEPRVLDEAAALLRSARRPLLIAGGGVIYSEAAELLATLAARTGLPVGETQAGKGSLPWDHPAAMGAVGATGGLAANRLAAAADLVVGVGTRWTDFTTASGSAFRADGVRFVNINIAAFDADKLGGLALVGDARATLEELDRRLADWTVSAAYREESQRLRQDWQAEVSRLFELGDGPLLMMAQEIVTSIQEELKLTIVLVDNQGFSSIGSLSRSLGTAGFGTRYLKSKDGRVPDDSEPEGTPLAVDLAQSAQGLGAHVIRARGVDGLRDALLAARTLESTVVVHIQTDRYQGVPDYESWWDVPVAEVSNTAAVQE